MVCGREGNRSAGGEVMGAYLRVYEYVTCGLCLRTVIRSGSNAHIEYVTVRLHF